MDVVRITLPVSLTATQVAELASALEAAARDEEVRSILVCGSTEGFCRGLDLDALDRAGPAEAPWRAAADDFCRCLRALRYSDKAAVALVDGPALGGGVGLAAACDVVVASERASFGFPEVLFGLAPGMILPFVLERMSAQAARLWIMSGLTRSALEAEATGLVDAVVPLERLEGEGRRWLRTLGRAHHRGRATVKELTRKVPALGLEQALELGRGATVSALDDPEVRSAIASFREFGVLPWEEE